MDAPKEGAWGIKLSAEHFKMAKQAGFDHVRLPVRFSAHTEATPPYKLTEALLLRVDWAVNQALGLGLSIVIDIHHWAEIYEEPEANRAKFIEIWKQVATRLKGRPPEVVFELLNEPRRNLTAALWNEFSAEAVKAIRTISPTRDIMIEGVDFASAKELRDTLRVPENDPHIIGSFHHYAPILFTHQGTDSIGPEYGTKGIVYPGPPAVPVVPVKEAMGVKWISDWIEKYNSTPADTNPCSPTVITQELERAKTWARKTGLRVYMGEFGANEFVDKASRIRWLRFIREEAEKRGIGWGLWNMFSGFAIGDAKAGGGFDPDLKAALMP